MIDMAPVRRSSKVLRMAARQAHDDAGEDDQGDAVADAALGDLLAEPHDEGRPGREGRARRRSGTPNPGAGPAPAPPGAEVLSRKNGDAERLDERDHHGPVAGPLGDLLAPHLPFLGELLEVRPDHREELQDDRGRDVGHDPEGEDRHATQGAAREQVQEAQDRALGLVGELGHRHGVDARESG